VILKPLRPLLLLSAVLITMLVTVPRAAHADTPVLVFAAASLTNSVTEIARAFEAETGQPVTPVFDATSRAARQITEGAPAHMLIAANRDWVDWLITCGQAEATARRVLVRNTLVLVASSKAANTDDVFSAQNPLLDVRRFAIADPEGVPAGIYARQSLEAISMWDKLEARLIRGDNVRTVLAWVGTGAAEAGLVYASDAAIAPRVAVAAVVPDHLHDAILYEAVLTRDAPAEAQAFLSYLSSESARKVFTRFGFSSPPAGDLLQPDPSPTAEACE